MNPPQNKQTNKTHQNLPVLIGGALFLKCNFSFLKVLCAYSREGLVLGTQTKCSCPLRLDTLQNFRCGCLLVTCLENWFCVTMVLLTPDLSLSLQTPDSHCLSPDTL